MDTGGAGIVGRTYTKGRRQPYLIRKWPGSNWALPLGPYTITQLLVFVGSVYLLLSYREVWAHFGGFNLVIGVGLPLLLTYLTRHSRIEGRDPLRTGVALTALMLQPRTGYLGGEPFRVPGPTGQRGGRFPVAQLPAELRLPAAAPAPPRRPPRGPAAGGPARRGPAPRGPQPWLAELLHQAGYQAGDRDGAGRDSGR
jgi:hypothetical protein